MYQNINISLSLSIPYYTQFIYIPNNTKLIIMKITLLFKKKFLRLKQYLQATTTTTFKHVLYNEFFHI